MHGDGMVLGSWGPWQNWPSDYTTIPILRFPTTVPSRGPIFLSGVHTAVVRIICVILIPFRLSKISCFTFRLKCFFSDSNKCPDLGIGPLLQFPAPPPRSGQVLLTLLFFPLLPLSCWVLHGSIHSFLVVMYSCPLLPGVLQALLCLKVYYWCIRG